jgi:hypothetical protein
MTVLDTQEHGHAGEAGYPKDADVSSPAQPTDGRVVIPELLERYSFLICWVIALAFVAVEIRRVADQVTVRYPDFLTWAGRASRFDLRHLAEWQWVDGLYPLGYPLLLRLGVALGLDVLDTAFVISIFGGFLGLLGTFLLIRKITGSWELALFTEAILASTAHYLFFASLDSTDMLASGIMICSLAILFSGGRQRRAAFWSGVLAGLSYLIRYTGSLNILLCTLYLIGLSWARRVKPKQGRRAHRWWTIPAAFLLGAAVGAAPQLIASTLVKGNPFYTAQAHNLWFHVTGGDDYIFDWNAAPLDISLWEVVRTYPKQLVTHWLREFLGAWTSQYVVVLDTPFTQLMHAGLLFTVLATARLRHSVRVFLGTYVVGTIALLSIIRLDKRFLITLMPLLVFASVYFLWTILPARIRARRVAIPVRFPIMILLTLWSMNYPLQFMSSNPRDRGTLEVSNTLHAAGMQSAGEVYMTHLRFHDVVDPWKRSFTPAFAVARSLDSYDDLLGLLKRHGHRFLIYDHDTGVLLYPDLEFLLSPESRPEGLAPVYMHPERKYVIYRVLGNEAPQPMDVSWVNGIKLTGYEMYLSDDEPRSDNRHRLGVYLYWQATQPMFEMRKVFVHVIDANGQLVAQHDGVPALWTYPTSDWKVGEVVVDFHSVVFESPLSPGTYTVRVGLYASGPGRDAVVDSSGAPVGDFVILETLTIP